MLRVLTSHQCSPGSVPANAWSQGDHVGSKNFLISSSPPLRKSMYSGFDLIIYFSDIPLCLYLHAYCRLATLWNSHRIHTQSQLYFHSTFGCSQGLWSFFVWSNCCSLRCRLSGYYWAAYACLEDNSFKLT